MSSFQCNLPRIFHEGDRLFHAVAQLMAWAAAAASLPQLANQATGTRRLFLGLANLLWLVHSTFDTLN